MIQTIENKRNTFLFMAVSHNQCSRLPTDPARSKHIIFIITLIQPVGGTNEINRGRPKTSFQVYSSFALILGTKTWGTTFPGSRVLRQSPRVRGGCHSHTLYSKNYASKSAFIALFQKILHLFKTLGNISFIVSKFLSQFSKTSRSKRFCLFVCFVLFCFGV